MNKFYEIETEQLKDLYDTLIGIGNLRKLNICMNPDINNKN